MQSGAELFYLYTSRMVNWHTGNHYYNDFSAVPSWCDQFSTKSSLKTPHMGCVYGVFFVDSNSDLYSTSVTAVLYAVLCYIGPCYNGTWLHKNSRIPSKVFLTVKLLKVDWDWAMMCQHILSPKGYPSWFISISGVIFQYASLVIYFLVQ